MKVKARKSIYGSIPKGTDGITLDGRPVYIEDAPAKKVKIRKKTVGVLTLSRMI